MKKVATVFAVDNSKSGTIFEGAGQETCSAALKAFPKQVVVIKGFMIDEVFIPIDLTGQYKN